MIILLAWNWIIWMYAELLHLDPKSPEAQVFYQLQRNSSQTANSPAPTPSGTYIFMQPTINFMFSN